MNVTLNSFRSLLVFLSKLPRAIGIIQQVSTWRLSEYESFTVKHDPFLHYFDKTKQRKLLFLKLL